MIKRFLIQIFFITDNENLREQLEILGVFNSSNGNEDLEEDDEYIGKFLIVQICGILQILQNSAFFYAFFCGELQLCRLLQDFIKKKNNNLQGCRKPQILLKKKFKINFFLTCFFFINCLKK